MLILQGLLRAATTLGGGVNKKTGEVIPLRNVLRGLVQVSTITVPDLSAYSDKIGQKVNLPVRAWATGATVNFMYENPAQTA